MASKDPKDKPRLDPRMEAEEFTAFYWLKAELVEFAKKLQLPTHGYKPELSTRIERHLRGQPPIESDRPPRSKRERDSAQPLTRETPVVIYKSDAATRAFFQSEIGPEFHFTYRLNQFRLQNENLTYGDLIDEWLAERDRRSRDDYLPPLARHGRYNRFIRAFFADPANKGKTIQDGAKAWNERKHLPMDRQRILDPPTGDPQDP